MPRSEEESHESTARGLAEPRLLLVLGGGCTNHVPACPRFMGLSPGAAYRGPQNPCLPEGKAPCTEPRFSLPQWRHRFIAYVHIRSLGSLRPRRFPCSALCRGPACHPGTCSLGTAFITANWCCLTQPACTGRGGLKGFWVLVGFFPLL